MTGVQTCALPILQGHRPSQDGGGRHCQTQGETPLRGRAAQSSLWVWGPDGAGSSAPGEALGRGEEGAGRLRQKAERRLSPRHPPEPQQPRFSQSFSLAPLGHDPRPRGPSGSIGFGGQNPWHFFRSQRPARARGPVELGVPVFPWSIPLQRADPHDCGSFLAGAACLFPRRHDLHSPNGEGLTIHTPPAGPTEVAFT